MLNYCIKPFSNFNFLQNFVSTLNNIHESQSKFLNDNLILVNEEDSKIGEATKLKAHLLSENNTFPHRAFSVFLFNDENKMLLQQRSKLKVTFPLLWSNTCCSHPLNIKSQNKKKNILNAVIKRVDYEMGIKTLLNDYKLIDKVIYRANAGKMFEEFELDYIFITKVNGLRKKDVLTTMNTNEVQDVKFLAIKDILKNVKNNPEIYSPWFKMVMNKHAPTFLSILKGKEYTYDNKIRSFL